MAINRPATKTKISTTEWGWPITDQVNANTTDIAAKTARTGAERTGCQTFPTGAYTEITWATLVQDTNNFVASSSRFTIPAGLGGVYVICIGLTMTAQNTGCYLSVVLGSTRWDFPGNGNGYFSATAMKIMVPGEQAYGNVWNGVGATLTPSASRISLFRVSL